MDTGTAERNLEVEGPSIRGHIESAVAEHAPHHSAIGPLVDRAVEEHAREIKKQNEILTPADRKDKLRHTIRNAIVETKQRPETPPAAPTSPLAPKEAAKGAPIHWSDDSKAGWNNLPYSVRADVLREQNSLMENVLPRLKAHAEIEQVIAPHRDLIPQGLKEPEVIGNMFQWYRGLRGPNRAAYFVQLMAENGTSLQDVANVVAQAAQPQQYQPQQPSDPQTREYQRLAAFAQGKPLFETVRQTMGQMLSANEARYKQADGETNLDLLYHDAVQHHQSQGSGQSEAQIELTIRQFSQGKPYFQAVRHSMGLLLSAHPERYAGPNGADLAKLYADAMKADGITDNKNNKNNKRAAAVSPSTKSPAGALVDSKKAVGIRASIKRAIAESRGII